MRRESKSERAAWTAHIEGKAEKTNKYGNERSKMYASNYEAEIAGKLAALQIAGKIRDLREQVPITLVEGRGKIRPIKYIADFVYVDDQGVQHVIDAKGVKTQLYRVKRKLAALLLNIDIEEV